MTKKNEKILYYSRRASFGLFISLFISLAAGGKGGAGNIGRGAGLRGGIWASCAREILEQVSRKLSKVKLNIFL